MSEMSEMKPRRWFQARLKWAVLKQSRGLDHWRKAEHFFLSEDWEAAFQEALRIGYRREYSLHPAPKASRIDCRFAEVEYLEEIGTDPTSFAVDLGNKPAHEAIGFDHEFDPAGHVPAPIF